MTDHRSKPLLTVITASYNAIAGLRKTVASVAGQRGDGVEHVIIDGGSTDGTGAYLESRGDKIRWVSEPDDGIADALNKGVAMARGDYVLILQAGDTFADPNVLNAVEPFLDGRSDIVSGPVIFIRDGQQRLWPAGNLSKRMALHMTMPHQGMFCHRHLFDRIGLFDTKYRITMDYDWLMRAWRAGAKSSRFDKPIAIMPDDGVSSRVDWPGMSTRLREVRRLHFSHAKSATGRIAYRAYWAAYWPYKRLQAMGRGLAK